MIRLVVINNKVVDFSVFQNGFDLEKVFLKKTGFNRVDQCNFFIYNEIRVVGDTVGQFHVVFKHVGATVVDTDVIDMIGKIDLIHINNVLTGRDVTVWRLFI